MPESAHAPSAPTWAKAIAQPATPWDPTPLKILSGSIPASLRGSLYRNGPARLERGGQRVGHWFDGDGAILGVYVQEGQAIGVYRYVQTAGYQAESESDQFEFGGYGMTHPGSIWQRWGKSPKNAANTSVLPLPDKVLALWEGGQPHALDPETLQTSGLDNLGSLTSHQPYSAHPKRDPITGEIINFGVSLGQTANLTIYVSQPSGQIQRQQQIALDCLPLIHDFVLAGRYLIFCIPSVRLQVWPILLGLKSYSECLKWHPELPTQILIIDRERLEIVSRIEAEPWYQWHVGNGHVGSDGDVCFTLARYPDFQTNQYLKEVASGSTQTAVKSTLWQIRLDPIAGRIREQIQLVDHDCEFPAVDPRQVGQATQRTYLSLHRPGLEHPEQELFTTIGSFDHLSGTLQIADLGPHRYPSEPILAPDPDHPDQGWVLTVVFDGQQETSELWIFASDQLTSEPMARLQLPHVVPPSFHGNWQAR